MELTELKVFVKVVQTGSFTRAADALGSQKAQVSRVVGKLERRLGARLLERSTRALSLTELGRDVFERAVGILGAVDEVQRVSQQMQAEPRGTLRLTCGVEFGLIAVSQWIGDYLQRYPQVSVEADLTGRVVDLVHEGFDLAIRIGYLADSGLAARKLGDIHYGLYAAPGYLALRGMPDHPDALAQHELLYFSGGANLGYWPLNRGPESARVALPTARLRVNNSLALRDAARAGLGIACLPQLLATPGSEASVLTPVLPSWQLPPIPVHAVFAGLRYLTPKVRAFIDLAAQAFAESGHAITPAPVSREKNLAVPGWPPFSGARWPEAPNGYSRTSSEPGVVSS